MLPLRALDLSSQLIVKHLNNFQFPPLPAWCEGVPCTERGVTRYITLCTLSLTRLRRWNNLEDNPNVQQWSNIGIASAYLVIALVAAVGVKYVVLACCHLLCKRF